MVCAHRREEQKGQAMGKRSEAVLTVTFGPASTPTLPRALSYAREHADTVSQVEPGAWRATFRLAEEEEPYGRAVAVSVDSLRVADELCRLGLRHSPAFHVPFHPTWTSPHAVARMGTGVALADDRIKARA